MADVLPVPANTEFRGPPNYRETTLRGLGNSTRHKARLDCATLTVGSDRWESSRCRLHGIPMPRTERNEMSIPDV